ncbi:MAG: hypothetical protein LBO66_10070 [Deltaproteobacteria bacterium]|jgi:hypothetical protein|nr:hypothetical protein [Deltaproteobacteria bacterium]
MAVRGAGETSVSFILRRLNIGYNRPFKQKEAWERARVIWPQKVAPERLAAALRLLTGRSRALAV